MTGDVAKRGRVAVYTDYVYRRSGATVFAERAFATFLDRVGSHLESLVVVGRLSPEKGEFRYPLGSDVGFVALPYYPRLTSRGACVALLRSVRSFWSALDRVDVVWLLGPHPASLLFAALAALRRRRVVLGVRQDTVAYVRHRHPRSRGLHVIARALDAAYRALARRAPVAVVGEEIAGHYSEARSLLQMSVSLISDADILPEAADGRSYDGELTVLSVGRLEQEKNPLMLADVLHLLRQDDPRWRLVVCGEGPMEQALRERLDALGVAEHAELRGYVALHDGLLDAYRRSHAMLHVSMTEGVPQVLFEAFASRLPVVATRVGGVASAVGDAAVIVPPDDPAAAAAGLRRVASDPGLRRTLTVAGAARVAEHTLEIESRRVADFLVSHNGGVAAA